MTSESEHVREESDTKPEGAEESEQLAIFYLRPMLIGYACISRTDQTLGKRNPFTG